MRKNYDDAPLWEAYWSDPSSDNLTALLLHYGDYMRSIIKKTCTVMPNWIDLEDLFQEASIALAGLIPRYTREIAEKSLFTSYAYRRVRGSIIDYMRINGPKHRRRSIHYVEIESRPEHGEHGHKDEFFNSIEDEQEKVRTTKAEEELDISGFSRLLPTALQQYVFRLYFIERLSMRLIGKLVRLSESRISQYINVAMRIIREREHGLLNS
jgi:RNA polymerase sigma factor (sigma-70 family)